MAKKDFSRINPTEKFFGAAHPEQEEQKEKTDEREQEGQEGQEEQVQKSSISSKKKKTNSDYLRLDIYDYKEYLTVMAGFKRTSVTKYIQALICADMQQNKDTFDKLKNI